MSYKWIFTYCDDEADLGGRLATALDMASRFEAHLTVLTLGYLRELPYGDEYVTRAALAEWQQDANASAEALARSATEHLTRSGVRGEARPLVTFAGGLESTFGKEVRLADLVVLGRPEDAAHTRAAEILAEGALFDGGATTLICPARMPEQAGKTIVIAWNGGREALRAVRRAMPFLKGAGRIEIAAVDTGRPAEPSAEDLAILLSRHGLEVEVAILPREGQAVSDVLLQRLADTGADLLVMGAYGRSRLREFVLGGVTRDMLRNIDVPTLMAH